MSSTSINIFHYPPFPKKDRECETFVKHISFMSRILVFVKVSFNDFDIFLLVIVM